MCLLKLLKIFNGDHYTDSESLALFSRDLSSCKEFFLAVLPNLQWLAKRLSSPGGNYTEIQVKISCGRPTGTEGINLVRLSSEIRVIIENRT